MNAPLMGGHQASGNAPAFAPSSCVSALNETMERGRVLSESSTYRDYLSNPDNGLYVQDPSMRAVTAQLMENANAWCQGLDESTQLLHVGNFKNYMFQMIRGIIPELAATELISTQALTQQQGFVFFMDYVYSTTKGQSLAGQRVAPENDRFYSSPEIPNESIGTGDGADPVFNSFLSFSPILKGTVTLTDGVETFKDSNGTLTGSAGGSGTIDYDTGQVNVTFNAAPANAASVTVSYEYQMEGNEAMGGVDLQFTSSPVIARPRKLGARWTLEGAFSAQSQFNIDVESELLQVLVQVIRAEINFEIVNRLLTVASASSTPVTWDRTPPDPAVPWRDHKETFIDAVIDASNRIHQATGIATGTWLVAGTSVMNVIESLPQFVPAGAPQYPAHGGANNSRGLFYAGTLSGRWKVYKDPSIDTNRWMVGYRGDNLYDTGMIYAPWLPVYTIPSYMLGDMVGRKVLGSMYALKTVNPKMYQLGTMVATGSGGRSF